MNKTDAKKIVASLLAAYTNYRPPDIDAAAKVWLETTEEYSYEEINAGLNIYMQTDTKGFPPVPGQIIEIIHKMTEPQELNEMEAWSLVSKAIRNSHYNSVEEFAKLPPIVQKAVGLPDQLREWASDERFNEGVVRGHFISCYKVVLEREREIQKMPKMVREMIAKINENSCSGQIEKKRQKVIEESNIRRQNEIKALESKSECTLLPEEYKYWKGMVL